MADEVGNRSNVRLADVVQFFFYSCRRLTATHTQKGNPGAARRMPADEDAVFVQLFIRAELLQPGFDVFNLIHAERVCKIRNISLNLLLRS